MIDADLQPLFVKWAADKLLIPEWRIKSVDFGVIHGGYCETCEYETFGAEVALTSGRYTQIEEEAATVIRELFALKEGV
jgi:hypothetical protein